MALLPLIRPIEKNDNPAVEQIIKQVMTEFACVGEGYSIEDPEVKDMFTAYQQKGARFFVIEMGGEVLGCGGYAALEGAQSHICELRKMYFLSKLRGMGMGQKLLNHCIEMAKKDAYSIMYLETVERMTAANALYQKRGFKALKQSLGHTGHSSCDAFYMLDLECV